MSPNGSTNHEDFIPEEPRGNSGLEDSDLELENPKLSTLKFYTSRIIDSLKRSLSHSLNTEKIANESLVDLCAQNDQINRIKLNLNETHDSLSFTEKMVDKYLAALDWLSSSIRMNDQWKLDIRGSQEKFNSIGSKFSKNDPSEGDSTFDKDKSAKTLEDEFYSHTTLGLNSLLSNMRGNRLKTDLISNIIVHQNDELEKINSSAQSLRNRVSKMNSILKGQN